MNKIGFTNFRRFADFPDLEYGPITFLVGKNNSGKSTMVKAILLINNYLKSDNIYRLGLADKVLDETNIVTFGRAKNIEDKKNDSIKFSYQLNNIAVQIIVTGDEDDTDLKVVSLDLTDSENGYKYEILPNSGITITITKTENFTQIKSDLSNQTNLIMNKIITLQHSIKELKDKKRSREYYEMLDNLNQLYSKKEILSTENKDSKTGYSAEVSIDYSGKGLSELIQAVLEDIELNYKDAVDSKEMDKDMRDFYLAYKYAYDDQFKIEKSFNKVVRQLTKNSVVYLGSYSIKQKALFFIKDTHNPLAQAIHEYKQLGIDLRPGSIAYSFTRKWIKEFEIADDFKIIMHAGEAYEVKLISKLNEVQLADKGMGSVQAMLLILRLACIIEKYEERFENILVIIEEPELNLHPALQSKISDLLLFVYQLNIQKKISCNIEFIVETHSEYIIRKTQVTVAINELESSSSENPFFVYYFPYDKFKIPYKLEYNNDGSFKNNFGEGFFDEASSSTLELLKLKRQKKA